MASPILLIPRSGLDLEVRPFDPTERVHLGRSSDATVQLRHARISRKHAELKVLEDRWVLRDNHSKHGTTHNGIDLDPEALVILERGDVIGLGPWSFTVDFDTEERPSLPVDTSVPAHVRVVQAEELIDLDPSAAALAVLYSKLVAIDESDPHEFFEAVESVFGSYLPGIEVIVVLPTEEEIAASFHAELIKLSIAKGMLIASDPSASDREPRLAAIPIKSSGSVHAVLVARSTVGPLQVSIVTLATAAQIIGAAVASRRTLTRNATRARIVVARKRFRESLASYAPGDRAKLGRIQVREGHFGAQSGRVTVTLGWESADEQSASLILMTAAGNAQSLESLPALLAYCIERERLAPAGVQAVAASINRALSLVSDTPAIVDLAVIHTQCQEGDMHAELVTAGDVQVYACRVGAVPQELEEAAHPPLGIDAHQTFDASRFVLPPGDRLVVCSLSAASDVDQTGDDTAPFSALIGSPTPHDDYARLSQLLQERSEPRRGDDAFVVMAFQEIGSGRSC